MVACGGGSESAKLGSEPALTGKTIGYIHVEEKSGKRIFDAWFVNETVASTASADRTSVWESADEYCVQIADTGSNSLSTTVSNWHSMIDAGEAVRFSSRTENVITLLPQRFGNTVTYASNERWLASAIPEDTVIEIEGSEQYKLEQGVPIAPLETLVQTYPLSGNLIDIDETLQWEVSASADDTIEITLSQNDASTNTSVVCSLLDTGSFLMPNELRSIFSSNKKLMVYMTRLRQAVHEQGDTQLIVSQSSVAQ